MSKLVFFGDSFVSLQLTVYAWPNLLAKKLGISKENVLNFGKPGTNIEYSVLNLLDYVSSPQYSISDIIIFVVTTPGRPPIDPKEDQGHASAFGQYIAGEKTNKTDYFKKHDAFYRTWFNMQNAKTRLKDLWLIAFTLKQLPNLTLYVPAFDSTLPDSNKLLDNNENFIMLDTFLYSISEAEFKNDKKFPDMISYFGNEQRSCHLSNSNNSILADQLAKCISTKSSKYFNKKEFLTKMYDFSDEYETVYLKEFNPASYKKKKI